VIRSRVPSFTFTRPVSPVTFFLEIVKLIVCWAVSLATAEATAVGPVSPGDPPLAGGEDAGGSATVDGSLPAHAASRGRITRAGRSRRIMGQILTWLPETA
jgi:hypothetical protein